MLATSWMSVSMMGTASYRIHNPDRSGFQAEQLTVALAEWLGLRAMPSARQSAERSAPRSSIATPTS